MCAAVRHRPAPDAAQSLSPDICTGDTHARLGALSAERRPSREQLLQVIAVQNDVAATQGGLGEVLRLVGARAAEMTGADAGVVELPEGGEPVLEAAHRARSTLCVPLLHHGTVVGVLRVSSDRRAAFDDTDAEVLALLSGVIAARIANAAEHARLDRESRRHHDQAVAGLRALARAIDAKDPMTRQHSDRVAQLAAAIADRLDWDAERLRLLHEAALLHDVGKIGIPDSILLKPGRLDAEEYRRIKEHAPLGAMIVDDVLSPEQVGWIRWHHERPDGHGYPDGLTDPDIPDGAAIIALADTWDVMTISRPYSPPMPAADALDECRSLAGRQFRAGLIPVLTEHLVAAGAGARA